MTALELTAPSAWACYLFYGDASALGDEEETAIQAWLTREGVDAPVSREDAGFMWHHDAFTECPLGADCQTYVFLTP